MDILVDARLGLCVLKYDLLNFFLWHTILFSSIPSLCNFLFNIAEFILVLTMASGFSKIDMLFSGARFKFILCYFYIH